MPAFVVAKLTITDPETYARYGAGFMAAFTPFGGKLLSVDEAPEVIEGEWRCTRTVLLEFPSKTVMKAWYASPAYQDLVQHRFAASTADIVLLEGFAPPAA
ncbi:DUF1330 domain-containing protein [Hyphomonas sp.]|jgi:uncharacterized protein (DUF1330 family)|uniref:DUF1330 domain-containing protein n=1 Tax=Hyphomonas sp. TaxID=87 RepID=UPI0025C019CE|nr:DUF1330 domain-containing protein [Hyphomonas sp.]